MSDEKIKTYRIVCDDIDGDNREDFTLSKGNKKIVTLYDWRSILLSWFCSASALFAAGVGVVQFL